jgi:hypothetical protein
MWRVLEPGGFLFIVARWQVGRWAAKGLEARPYAELGLKDKIIKASVPIRAAVWFRALRIMPKRLWRVLGYCANSVPSRLNYGKLNPNINEHIGPDSSAESSIDPFEVWLWYRSRGAICLNYPTLLAGYFIRTGALTFQKPMNAKD